MPVSRKTVKPFLKWAGGKRQLLPKIKAYYPFRNKEITKYAEPFVGGGAVLFDVLNQYDLEQVYISDVNADLTNPARSPPPLRWGMKAGMANLRK